MSTCFSPVRVKVDQDKCDGCAACLAVCAVEALRLDNGRVTVSDDCFGCGACEYECPTGALSLQAAPCEAAGADRPGTAWD
jgi:NAD-dependent dihydropyrimidine dehydrogenase PreA subunit